VADTWTPTDDSTLVAFPGISYETYDPQTMLRLALRKCADQGWTRVVVIGTDEEGEAHYLFSDPDGPCALADLQIALHRLVRVMADGYED